MSIYREIEETDKVFGRVRKVSAGLFSTGFELTDFHFDKTEIKSSISGWVQPDIDNTDNPSVHIQPEINEFGNTTNYPTDNSSDESETTEINKEHWNNVSFGDYYVNVYNEETYKDGVPNDNSSSQFSISYGNKNGYGSLNESKSTSATQAVYNQYKNILLGPGDSSWTFALDSATANFKDRDSIYVINFSSANLKEKFDPGNLEFRLSVKHGDIVETETFRDDSRFSSSNSSRNPSTGKVYQIVRGAIVDEFSEDARYATGTGEGSGEGFGFAYPDLGILILNPFALSCHFGTRIEERLVELGNSQEASTKTNTGRQLSWYGNVDPSESSDEDGSSDLRYGTERNHQNFMKLFGAIKRGSSFKSRSTEYVPSKHYFIRVKNTDFNYSNNPSFVYGGKEATQLHEEGNGPNRDYWVGRLRHEDFIDDPKSYITTIGLYNGDNELVAVAKLSVPVLKSFDTETLIKVKLDF
jgi:hypothetical protein|tara:strand:+ start:1075 stop:2484 length:1410 start_codon:yes stop_codon:yes gene_type:complete